MLWYPNLIKNVTGFDAYHGWDVELPKILFRKLNARVKLKMYPLDYPLGIVDDQGNSDGALADVVTGISDILLISRYEDTIGSLPTTYMHWEAGLSIMTQFNGELSQLEKTSRKHTDQLHCNIFRQLETFSQRFCDWNKMFRSRAVSTSKVIIIHNLISCHRKYITYGIGRFHFTWESISWSTLSLTASWT